MAETITPENKKLLTSLGIAIAAYLLVVKPIFRALGLQKTPEELAKAKSDAVNIADIQKNLSAKGIVLSKTKAEWDIIADTIYNDLKYSALNDNKADAGYQVTRVKNDADIIYLIHLIHIIDYNTKIRLIIAYTFIIINYYKLKIL